jgi:hypothetical protein
VLTSLAEITSVRPRVEIRAGVSQATMFGPNAKMAARQIVVKAVEPARHSIVEIDGELSYAWSNAMTFSVLPGPIAIAAVGRYFNVLGLDDDVWRFQSRVIVPSGAPVPESLKPLPTGKLPY